MKYKRHNNYHSLFQFAHARRNVIAEPTANPESVANIIDHWNLYKVIGICSI